MKTPLFKTQLDDVARQVAGRDVPNFSEPGTGKTLTTIGAIEASSLDQGIILCPTIATSMWTKLLREELGATVQHVDKSATEYDNSADFHVISTGLLTRLPYIGELRPRVVVLDESHYFKSREAARTQAAFGPMIDDAEQVWCLTGTPIERYSDDLWPMLSALHSDLLAKMGISTYMDFIRYFCIHDFRKYGGMVAPRMITTGNQNEAILNHLLYKKIGAIRRTMKEVNALMPRVLHREISVEAKIGKDLLALVDGKTRAQLADMIVKGNKHMASARKLLGMAKLVDSAKYIEEVASKEPVVVGCWHTDVIEQLWLHLNSKGINTERITGGTQPAVRNTVRDSLVSGETKVIVGQIQAMGVAMDGLQHGCKRVIMMEDDWSPGKIEQFYKRVARMGQKYPVQVDYLKAPFIVDEIIQEIREGKQEGIDLIVNSA